MPEITATVVAKSEYGIKVEQDGDWWNWSKPEYRGEPFNTEVQKGDRVQITYAETDGGKTYITTIGKVTAYAPTAASGQRHGGAGDEGQGPDQPFPPAEEFPPDEPQVPSAADPAYGQEVWAKDKLRARTDCVACATGIFKSCLEAGILKEFPSADTVVEYAVVLEAWAKGE